MKNLVSYIVAIAIAMVSVLTVIPAQEAQAACGSAVPYIFTNNVSIVDSTTTNANNAYIVTCLNNVDNSQIGASGIFASQILPTSTVTATFGGSYGYKILLASSTQVPMTIVANASQSVDLFDVTNNNQSTKYFAINSAGNASFSGNAVVTGLLSAGATGAGIAGDISAARGGSATTGYYYFGTNGSQYLGFNGTNFSLAGGALSLGNINGAAITGTSITGTTITGTGNNQYFGTTTGQTVITLGGGNTGSADGIYLGFQNGGALRFAIGNYSSIYGGGYNQQPTFYSNSAGPFYFNTAITSAGALTASSYGNTTGTWLSGGSNLYITPAGAGTSYVTFFYDQGQTHEYAYIGYQASVFYGSVTATNVVANNAVNNPSFSYTNNVGGSNQTQIGSFNATTVAGVGGGAFLISSTGVANEVAVDGPGNMGIAGGYYSASSRTVKDNIIALPPGKASQLVAQTDIVQYCYKAEKCKPGQEKHIGFIAEDTSVLLAPGHNSMDVNAVASVTLQAVKELQGLVGQLSAQVDVMKARIKQLEAKK